MASAALRVPALKKHTSTIIVAHGLGDSGAGWNWLADQWRLQNKFEETAFIFPNAPQIPITLNSGMRMPGWYDITSFDDLGGRDHDEEGIKRSQTTLHALIDDEVKAGIPSNRIILGGFSQGAAMSLVAGLTCPIKLGGIFALSGYLLLQHKIQDMIPPANANKDTPIFMGHGDADPVVRYDWGVKSAELLRSWGRQVDFKTYKNLAHSASPEEINDLETYLTTRLEDQNGSSSSS